ncbi:MAG: flagellar hook-associated protein FlgK [Alphaproteobacteria bacterium]|nr:flagellar hook-associated protein FlgK [Alphaproteobacteria bacterium]
MSLSLALNNALSGIKVTQASLAVLANNTANANTPGYSRQVVQQSQAVYESQGSGARIDQIVRKIDMYLNRAVQGQTSKISGAEVLSDYMSRIQIQMGQPGGTNSMDEYIEDLFNMFQTLATSPELSSSTYQVAQAANTLAQEISGLALEMENLRYTADQDIQANIKLANEEILRIADINKAISRAYALGESTASLLDQRDIAINKLSQYMDVKVNEMEAGQVYLYTNSGVALLEHVPYRIQYNGTTSLDTFKNDGLLAPITVDAVMNGGQLAGKPTTIVSGGYNTDITTLLGNGKIKALLDVRDKEIPAMLSQLDQLAAKLRDSLNAVHNAGSGSPPASTLTGTRLIGREDSVEWTGQMMIAALDPEGKTPDSRYVGDEYGQLPLTIDFDKLRSEYGDRLTVETIMKEINSYYTPQNRAEVGGLNNISIASLSKEIPGVSGIFEFDLDLQNITDSAISLWVDDVRVFDDGGVPMVPVNTTYPTSVPLDAANTFTTTPGSNIITVAATGHGLSNGDTITFDTLSVGSINGIPASDIANKTFKVTNVTATGFDIEVESYASTTPAPPVSDGAASLLKAYDTTQPGQTDRTSEGGTMSVDLSGNLTAAYYTVEMDIMVDDGEGNMVASTVSYRIPNNATSSTLNDRFAVTSVTGAGTMEVPVYSQPLVKAILVNEKGLPAGPNEKGYLQIVGQKIPGSTGDSYTVAIDDLSSRELGVPYADPPRAGSGRGFSHYFGLNDFFVSNQHTATGDTVAGSALALRIRSDILADPNLISSGTLTRGLTSAGSDSFTNYTYERTAGDNSVARKLADIGLSQLKFAASGGLSASTKTFNGYASEILAYGSSRATTATSTYSDEETLMSSYQSSVDAVSGVNIDEEMANTVILQNAYSGSAQVIKVVKDLFDQLLSIMN